MSGLDMATNLGPATWSTEVPTAQLRRYGVRGLGGEINITLQQAWLIQQYEGGALTKQRTEWRDIPLVLEPTAGVEPDTSASTTQRPSR